MGCDIHLVLERKTEAGWLGLDSFRGHQSRYSEGRSYPAAGARNYLRFAAMAGVRGEGPKPLGIPDDASELTKFWVKDWDSDGHSHSWMKLADAAKLFNEIRDEAEPALDPKSYQAKYPASYWFDIDDDGNLEDYRLIFWFDN